jgi:hypothetical protein
MKANKSSITDVRKGSVVEVTQENYNSLKKLYDKSVKDNMDVYSAVEWNGITFVLGYLKYVLLVMEQKLGVV